MALSTSTGNNVADIVASQLKDINDVVNDANAGTGQAANLAVVKQTLEANQDGIEASVGQSGFDAIENKITLLNEDFRDGTSAQGGAGSAYNQDMGDFISMLNNAGLQVDVSVGQGHYDAGTVLANATGYNVDADQADAAIASSGQQLADAVGSMNNTLAATPQYNQGVSEAGQAMSALNEIASNWANGANLSASQKVVFTASLQNAQNAAQTFQSDPTQSGQFVSAYNSLLQTMNGVGYTGASQLNTNA